jgi:hypothetical protein
MIVRREKVAGRQFKHSFVCSVIKAIFMFTMCTDVYLYSFTTARLVLNREVAHARNPSWSFVPKCRNDSLGGILQGCWGTETCPLPSTRQAVASALKQRRPS